jgi:hypothetical protein
MLHIAHLLVPSISTNKYPGLFRGHSMLNKKLIGLAIIPNGTSVTVCENNSCNLMCLSERLKRMHEYGLLLNYRDIKTDYCYRAVRFNQNRENQRFKN